MVRQAGRDTPSPGAGRAHNAAPASPARPFKKGDPVFDKRDSKKERAEIVSHRDFGRTGARRQWLLQYPEARWWVWETDVRHAEAK